MKFEKRVRALESEAFDDATTLHFADGGIARYHRPALLFAESVRGCMWRRSQFRSGEAIEIDPCLRGRGGTGRRTNDRGDASFTATWWRVSGLGLDDAESSVALVRSGRALGVFWPGNVWGRNVNRGDSRLLRTLVEN